MLDDVLDIGGSSQAEEGEAKENPFSEGDWRREIGDDRLEKFEGVKDLSKAYFELEAWKGAQNKVMKLKEGASEEEKLKWRREVLGLPQNVEDYKVKYSPKDENSKEIFSNLKSEAFKLGIMPDQLDALMMAQEKNLEEKADLLQKKGSEELAERFKNFKNSLGVNWDSTVKSAQDATRAFIDEEMSDEFKALGLSSNPSFIKLLSKIGSELKSDSVIMNGETASRKGLRTPEEVRIAIKEIESDPDYSNVESSRQEVLSRKVIKLYDELNNLEIN